MNFANCDNIININTERELSECRSRTHAQPLWYSWNYSRNSHFEKLTMKVKQFFLFLHNRRRKTYPLIKFIFIAHQASLKYLGKICLIHLWFLSACHDIYNLISSHRSLLKRRINEICRCLFFIRYYKDKHSSKELMSNPPRLWPMQQSTIYYIPLESTFTNEVNTTLCTIRIKEIKVGLANCFILGSFNNYSWKF